MSIKIRYISQLSYIFSVSLMAKFLRESFHYIQLSAERCSVKTCCELPAEQPRIDILSLKNFSEVFIKTEELYMAFLALMHDTTLIRPWLEGMIFDVFVSERSRLVYVQTAFQPVLTQAYIKNICQVMNC